jgi:hypothetical protein
LRSARIFATSGELFVLPVDALPQQEKQQTSDETTEMLALKQHQQQSLHFHVRLPQFLAQFAVTGVQHHRLQQHTTQLLHGDNENRNRTTTTLVIVT